MATPESAKAKGRKENHRGIKASSCMRGKSGPRIVPALNVGSEWNERHESNYPLSPHHLCSPSDMERRKFSPLPRKHRRAQSEARSNAGPIEDPMEVDPVVLRPTESTPDLGIGPSTLPTSGPSTSHDQESNSMQTTLFRMIHLTTLFLVTQTVPPPRI